MLVKLFVEVSHHLRLESLQFATLTSENPNGGLYTNFIISGDCDGLHFHLQFSCHSYVCSLIV